nr:reverse transcriptase domain-containing protein [Tanacetum cinerariifolium]
MNTASSLGLGTLPSNVITNPKEDLKGVTTRSRTAYQGPTIPTTSSCLPKVVERETDATKDTVPPTNNESSKDVQPLVVQMKSLILNFKSVVAPIIDPVVAPESGVDEPDLGNPRLDKPVLDKLEVGFDHDLLLGRIGFFLGCSPKEFHDFCFGSGSSDFDCFGFDFDLKPGGPR